MASFPIQSRVSLCPVFPSPAEYPWHIPLPWILDGSRASAGCAGTAGSSPARAVDMQPQLASSHQHDGTRACHNPLSS